MRGQFNYFSRFFSGVLKGTQIFEYRTGKIYVSTFSAVIVMSEFLTSHSMVHKSLLKIQMLMAPTLFRKNSNAGLFYRQVLVYLHPHGFFRGIFLRTLKIGLTYLMVSKSISTSESSGTSVFLNAYFLTIWTK